MTAQRDRILHAAIVCIAEHGLLGTSIGTISRQAELSAGALYVHFRNKDEIIAEAVRTRSIGLPGQAEDWEGFKEMVTTLDEHDELDIVTVVRARLHLNAEVIRPGPIRDICTEILGRQLDAMAANLRLLHENGRIRLRRDARQTAIDIAAYLDGVLWIGLATGMPLAEVRQASLAGLDGFVQPPTAGRRAPGRRGKGGE